MKNTHYARYLFNGKEFIEEGTQGIVSFFIDMMKADDDKRYQLIDETPQEIIETNEDLEDDFLQSLSVPVNHTVDTWNEKQIEKQIFIEEHIASLLNDEMPF